MFKLFRGNEIHDRESLVRDVATRAAHAVMLRLNADADLMSVAEFRGYVRARATSVVREQIRQSKAGGASQFALLDALAATILERTVHLVLRGRLAQPVVNIPSPHVRLRIAA
jgi:hypothetical protein